jgi:hypothetical protein
MRPDACFHRRLPLLQGRIPPAPGIKPADRSVVRVNRGDNENRAPCRFQNVPPWLRWIEQQFPKPAQMAIINDLNGLRSTESHLRVLFEVLSEGVKMRGRKHLTHSCLDSSFPRLPPSLRASARARKRAKEKTANKLHQAISTLSVVFRRLRAYTPCHEGDATPGAGLGSLCFCFASKQPFRKRLAASSGSREMSYLHPDARCILICPSSSHRARLPFCNSSSGLHSSSTG